MLILGKLSGNIIPVRFLAFSLVGGLGVLIHLLTLSIVYKTFKISFVSGQATVTIVAMTFNFTLDNIFAYRDMRLRKWQWLRGLVFLYFSMQYWSYCQMSASHPLCFK